MFSIASKTGSQPAASASSDPYFGYVTLLLHGNGTNGQTNNTFLDSSTNNFTITRAGNVTQGSADAYVGPGNWGVGITSGNVMNIATTPALALGTGDFTIEMWVNQGNIASGVSWYDCRVPDTANAGFDVYVVSSRLGFGTNGTTYIAGTTTLKSGVWYHVALTRSGNTFKLFLNGTQEGPTYTGSATQNFTQSNTRLGGGLNGTANPGWISNARVLKGTALYTANFTAPTQPLTAIAKTVLLTANSPQLADMSGGNQPITGGGSPVVLKYSPFTFYQLANANYSIYMTGGTTSYLDIPYSLPAGDFTYEGWVYFPSLAASRTLICFAQAETTGRVSWFINTSGQLAFDIFGTGTTTFTSTSITVGSWNHFAIVRRGSVYAGFLNGVSAGTSSPQNGVIGINTSIGIGRGGTNTSGNFLGSISNARFAYNTALYTSAFTPPTTALTTTQSVANSSYSLSLDGTGDHIRIANNQSLSFYTGDFTVECWAYALSLTATNNIISINDVASLGYAAVRFQTTITTGVVQWLLSSTGSSWGVNISAGTVTANSWNHYAVTRTSGAVRFWLNGAQVGGTQTFASSLTTGGSYTYIGTNTSATTNFPGYISNVRVVKALALYSGTFTPSTAPLAVTQLAGTNIAAITQTSFSAAFSGTSQYVTAPSATWTTLAGTFTVECWMYFAAASTTASLIGVISTGGFTFFNDGTRITPYLVGTGNIFNSTFLLSGITVGTWYHVAVTRNSSNLMTMWVNGASVGSTTTATTYTQGVWQIGNSGFNGNISNFRANNTCLYTTTFTPSTSPLTNVTGTNLLTLQSSTFVDNSTNNYTITNVSGVIKGDNPFAGNTSLLTFQNQALIDNSVQCMQIEVVTNAGVSTFNPFTTTNPLAQTSYCNYFNGTNSYLQAPSNAVFTYGTADFTIEGWLYQGSTNGQGFFYDGRGSAGGVMPCIFLSSGVLTYFTANANRITGPTLVAGLWYHIALSRVNGSTKMFVNGAQVGSTYTDANSYLIGSVNLGSDWNNSATSWLRGFISNMRVIKGQGLYSSNFIPPTGPYTTAAVGSTGPGAATTITGTVSLLTCQSTTFIDNSPNALTITNGGSATTVTNVNHPFGASTYFLIGQSSTLVDTSAIPQTITMGAGGVSIKRSNPFTDTVTGPTPYTTALYGGSMYFDGTGDYLTLPSNQLPFSAGTGDFTFECWVYITSLASTRVIYDTSNGGDTTGTGRFGVRISTSGVVQVYTLAGTVLTSGGTVLINNWYHIAYSKNSSSGRLYLNGTQVNTTYADANNYVVGTVSRPIIGIDAYDASTGPFLGYMAGLRLVKGTGLYTTPFVPPVAPVTAVSGTSLLLSATNGGVFDSTTTIDLETSGSSQISTSVSKFGGGSIYFPTTSSPYLQSQATTTSQPVTIAFAQNDFTVELWVYFATNNGTYNPFLRADAASNFDFGYNFSTGNLTYAAATALITTAWTPSLSTWYHLAVCRSGTSTRAFINGTQAGATATDTSNFSAQAFRIGGSAFSATHLLSGYIDDLRVTNGVARYTTTFSVPTAAFPSQ